MHKFKIKKLKCLAIYMTETDNLNYAVYRLFDETDSYFFQTKTPLRKALYNLKKSKNEKLISIFANNYEVELLKETTYKTKPTKAALNADLVLWRTHFKDIKKIKAEHITSQKCNTLHNITRNQSLDYGMKRQYNIFCMIKDIFIDDIRASQYIFSEFDCIGNKYLYEIKSLTYSINKYPTAIMNTRKLLYRNMIFIFEYTEANEERKLFYHIYEPTRNYNKRFITPLNRCNTCEIIDIPTRELIEIENKKISLDENMTFQELDILHELDWLDATKYAEYEKVMNSMR